MRLVLLFMAVILFGVSSYANEAAHEQEHHKELPYYVALKGMYTLGETYQEEEGDDGYGIALDLGHRIGYGFAVEIDVTYENGDVTAVDEATGERITENAKYYTTSLDIAYVYEITHTIGVLAKVGYEYEYEEIADVTNNDTGFVFAAGAEYSINHEYKAVVEYETSTIDGPKGDVIFAGVMYNF